MKAVVVTAFSHLLGFYDRMASSLCELEGSTAKPKQLLAEALLTCMS